MGNHLRAVTANFLLHRIHRNDRAAGLFLRQPRHDLRDDETAEAIIECAADEAIFSEFLHGIAVDGGVSHAKAEFLYLLIAGGADIDVEFVDLRDFFVGVCLLYTSDAADE